MMKSGESRNSHLVPDLSGKTFSVLPLHEVKCIVSVTDASNQVQTVPPVPSLLRVFNENEHWILENNFTYLLKDFLFLVC